MLGPRVVMSRYKGFWLVWEEPGWARMPRGREIVLNRCRGLVGLCVFLKDLVVTCLPVSPRMEEQARDSDNRLRISTPEIFLPPRRSNAAI